MARPTKPVCEPNAFGKIATAVIGSTIGLMLGTAAAIVIIAMLGPDMAIGVASGMLLSQVLERLSRA